MVARAVVTELRASTNSDIDSPIPACASSAQAKLTRTAALASTPALEEVWDGVGVDQCCCCRNPLSWSMLGCAAGPDSARRLTLHPDKSGAAAYRWQLGWGQDLSERKDLCWRGRGGSWQRILCGLSAAWDMPAWTSLSSSAMRACPLTFSSECCYRHNVSMAICGFAWGRTLVPGMMITAWTRSQAVRFTVSPSVTKIAELNSKTTLMHRCW